MKKRLLILVTILFGCCCFVACYSGNDTSLPANPKVYEFGEIDSDGGYQTINFEGKTFVLYGTLINNNNIGKCLGYIDNGVDEYDRIFEINGVNADEYIIRYDCSNGNEMNQPDVYRELSTMGVEAPSDIESSGYDIWKE